MAKLDYRWSLFAQAVSALFFAREGRISASVGKCWKLRGASVCVDLSGGENGWFAQVK